MKKKIMTPEERNNFNEFCQIQSWEDAGDFIDERTAGRGHKQWRNDNLITHDPDDDSKRYSVVAGYFSKAKLLELLSTPECEGVRIYFCKSLGTIGDKPKKKYRDIFLMPTKKGGIDIYKIKDHIRDSGAPIPHDPKTGQRQPLKDKNGNEIKVDKNRRLVLKDEKGNFLLYHDNGEPIIELTNGILNASTPCPDHCTQFCQE